ncbi:hypothetical protein A6M21_01440 [Desulfotomaculum copahuensis]|uniref:Uncharacterized protein n=1 Tax=Desulfotomaculum copahuensis TaxID=1838280 RepID=A0A1B7LB25_9FIRM|nr:hypothetical protein A6M21_01440 [Desulfotomaculum copahuensis]
MEAAAPVNREFRCIFRARGRHTLNDRPAFISSTRWLLYTCRTLQTEPGCFLQRYFSFLRMFAVHTLSKPGRFI